ncbi:hypothetical protein JVT61DRAFT_9155 [Boletus reticuloceps]|uniref:HNH nuclease domain-containing protein n=1 Tax=Boletus reticuloceps TaxID=495285 RepID=A0A8I2YH29_9AGAM|nr:hypothetical protein JVT61DRAFT_9155 [Boletus reticuloceps]
MKTTINKSPLPLLESPRIQQLQLDKSGCKVYKIVLNAELHAVKHQQQENLMSARVVGYLLIEFYSQPDIFNDVARITLISWLTNLCEGKSQHEVIYGNGKHCRDKFLRLFRISTAQYPEPSSHPSRPSFDSLEDMITDSMDYQASMKALARDGYQCLLTGMIDRTSYINCVGLQAKAEHEKLPLGRLEVAHILNEPTTQGTNPEGDSNVNKTYFTASALGILESFGFSEFSDKFNKSEGIHEVWNLLSLEHNVHQRFDNFELWFEATEEPHCYKVCFFDELDRVSFMSKSSRLCTDPFVVDFSSKDELLPPPHPSLLALHATCARVAHMSGAAEFFDHIEWDAEEAN